MTDTDVLDLAKRITELELRVEDLAALVATLKAMDGRRMTYRDVNRCPVKGCPVVGHWPAGTRCPMHRGVEYDPPIPLPMLDEQGD